MDKALYIIKKNVLSIVCGFVALLAMIALAYPLAGMRAKFRTELTQRAQSYTQAQTLLKEQRFLPIVQPGAEAQPLDRFPTDQIITAGKDARDTVHNQSDELMNRAVALNKAGHDLLLPDTLPDPSYRVFDYRRAYLDVMQKQIPAALGSVMPPNQDEINKKIAELHQTEVEDKIYKINGQEANREQLEHDFLEIQQRLPEKLRQESATQHKLYMDPTALTINSVMNNPSARPTPSDVWYAQLSLWIQQDVAAAIIAANNNIPTSNILTDAVKRFSQLRIAEGISAYVQPAGGPAAAAPPDESGGTDVRDFTRSPTGHVSNDLYDVVQFNLVLEVDQEQIPLVLHELQRDKMMTVLGVEITPVDPVQADAQGYIYGSSPVVQLSLACESLLMRKWTVPLMPDDVKTALHVAPPAPRRPEHELSWTSRGKSCRCTCRNFSKLPNSRFNGSRWELERFTCCSWPGATATNRTLPSRWGRRKTSSQETSTPRSSRDRSHSSTSRWRSPIRL